MAVRRAEREKQLPIIGSRRCDADPSCALAPSCVKHASFPFHVRCALPLPITSEHGTVGYWFLKTEGESRAEHDTTSDRSYGGVAHGRTSGRGRSDADRGRMDG